MAAQAPRLDATMQRRSHRTVLMSDLVESVRLMQLDETGTVRRWQALFDAVEHGLLPRHAGRLVRDSGDGIVAEFADLPDALRCAWAMHAELARCCAGLDAALRMWLRIGLHVTDLIADGRDVYGHGVNVAARLMSLAGPGETVVSAAARDELVPGLDAEVEDLGPCFLKHIDEPVRAFRVGPAGPRPVVPRPLPQADAFRPTIAVLPFRARVPDERAGALGEALAEDLIAALSRQPQWQVVSRLSSARVVTRPGLSEVEAGERLGAAYVLSGRQSILGESVKLFIELVEVGDGRVVWADSRTSTIAAMFGAADDLVPGIVSAVSVALLRREFERARSAAMPNLNAFTLLLDAVAAMHELSQERGRTAREILEYLAERHPRAAEPRAWIGKWHFLRVAQAAADDPVREIGRARAELRRALDSNAEHALSLALDGHLLAYVDRDLDGAQARLEAALASNPSEPLAWLFLSALHCHRGEGAAARHAAENAQRLSPLDPLRYFYAIFAAEAELLCGEHAGAIELARESIRLNRMHLSSYATLAIAQQLAGQHDAARQTVRALLALRPNASVRRYIENHPGSSRPHVGLHADALREAGVPE
jgi:adenylate cyclase